VTVLAWIFWIGLAVVVYTYLGYGVVAWVGARLRRWLAPRPPLTVPDDEDLPRVTLLTAAYNEADVVDEKLANIRALRYPAEKLDVLFVTDGSTDDTPDRLREAPDVRVLHRDERAGKIAAMHRGMEHVDTPIVVFSDANAMLNAEALRNIVRHYQDDTVGAVAGEKRVRAVGDDATGAGEGLYWTYESTLRRIDDALHSVVGGSGELFSVRTALFRPVPPDTLLDDFMLTLRIAGDGYRVAYAPDAYAIENPSASLADEMERKVRIAAGGLQSILRLTDLFNPFRHGRLTFQYVSHRVLRWTLAPLLLPVLLGTNAALAMGVGGLYVPLLAAQGLFYAVAAYGYGTHTNRRGPAALYAPFYFLVMNAAVYLGFVRFVRGSQTVQWTKAQRAEPSTDA
jgi:cellulose synthase/poly-beta-1,6-N-acetylglucosamine synthase-like glycosyltransferase